MPSAPPLDIDLSAATRLLVVSPHPDDGTLGGAGLIERVRGLGGAVRVVQITSGDAFSTGLIAEAHLTHPTASDYRRYGAQRERESVAALRALGVARANVITLGFPDDGLCELAPDRRAITAAAFKSPYTHRASPPRSERLLSGIAYRGQDLGRELERILVDFRPTVVLMPHPRDEHPDHCTTHLWVHEALAVVATGPAPIAPVLLHYLVHYPNWPAADNGAAALAPPARLLTANSQWKSLALTPRERAGKERAVAAYKTQVLAIGPFLESFDRSNELYMASEPEGHAACWCQGEDVAAPRRSAARRTATSKQ
ncbi:MAG: PIG-L deacetylase family protein [Gemmatimonadaceae bacterium]